LAPRLVGFGLGENYIYGNGGITRISRSSNVSLFERLDKNFEIGRKPIANPKSEIRNLKLD